MLQNKIACILRKKTLDAFPFLTKNRDILSPSLSFLVAVLVRPKNLKMEINMVFHTNISEFSALEFTVSETELPATRLIIKNSGFELYELWSTEEGHSHEVWVNTGKAQVVRLNMATSNGEASAEISEDATRQDIVDELVDLWLELRKVRRSIEAQYTDYDVDVLQSEPKPIQKFWNKVRDIEIGKELDPDHWDFMFKSPIDETVCAYFELSESDRLAITH